MDPVQRNLWWWVTKEVRMPWNHSDFFTENRLRLSKTHLHCRVSRRELQDSDRQDEGQPGAAKESTVSCSAQAQNGGKACEAAEKKQTEDVSAVSHYDSPCACETPGMQHQRVPRGLRH